LVASFTVPQFPDPMPFVNLIRLPAPGQQLQSVVVVVAVVDVVVVAVVAVVDVVVVSVVEVVVVSVVDVVVVAVVAVVDVVVVTVAGVVVVVGTGGQTHPSRQSSSAPPGDPDGHVALPGGSHCSPTSTVPFPHTGPPCVVDVVVLVVVSVVAVVLGTVVAVVEVVVGTGGQTHPSRQSSSAPPGDPDGHVALPGGSHCSPASTTPFPQRGPPTVVEVVVLVVVSVVELVVDDVAWVVLVVEVASSVVLVEDVVVDDDVSRVVVTGTGQLDCGCGLQTRISLLESSRGGLSFVFATTSMPHFPGLPFFPKSTWIAVSGPQVGLMPSGVGFRNPRLHLPDFLTLNCLNAPGAHGPPAWFRQICRLKVQELLGVSTPS
jgi:hypothetical protein